jgi:hypothetical protein
MMMMPGHVSIVAVALAGTLCGCFVAEKGMDSGRIPLKMERFPAGQPIVAVAMVFTTGWVSVVSAYHDQENLKGDHVEACYVEFIDRDKPTLFVPETTHHAFSASILSFLKAQEAGWAIFVPGLDPMFKGDYEHDSAGLRLTYADSGNTGPVAALAKPYVVGDTPPPGSSGWPVTSTSSPWLWISPPPEPTTAPATLAAWHHLLDLTDFWELLRWKEACGRNQQEIRVICQAMVQAVQAYDAKNPAHKWTALQKRNIDLCRKLMKQP